MNRRIAIILLFLISINAVFAQDTQIARLKNEEVSEKKNVEKPAETVEENKVDLATERTKLISQNIGGKQKTLSLRETIEMALRNNPDILISQKNVKIAEFDLQSARGSFDTKFSFSSNFERTKSPLTNSLFSNGNSAVKSKVFNNSFKIEKPLNANGTVVSSEFTNLVQTTNDPFNSFRRSYEPSLKFSVLQPLFRGRKSDDSRRQIEIAKKNLSLTDLQVRQKTIETISQVQKAYWDLSLALKDLQVQQEAVGDTKKQLESTRRKIEQGNTAPIEIASLENQAAKFESAAFQSLENVTKAQNTLKNLIAESEIAEIWNENILPTDDINLDIPDVSLTEALNIAVQNRSEIKQNETSKSINEINRRFYKDYTKPQVDLTASYTMNGFAGSPNNSNIDFSDPNLINRVNELSGLVNLQPLPILPPNAVSTNLTGGLGKSFGNLFKQDFNTFQIGITINFPLENRRAKAELGKNLVEAERLELEKRQTSQNITAEVRNAVQSLQTLKLRLQSVKISRESAEKEFESEERKYNTGYATGSLFMLLEKQKNLTSAKAMEVQIRLEINKAISDFEKAIGSPSKDLQLLFR